MQAVEQGIGYAILPSCAMEEKLRSGVIDAVGLRDVKVGRTAGLATSMLFPMSIAAERVHLVVEELVRQRVQEGRWQAELLTP